MKKRNKKKLGVWLSVIAVAAVLLGYAIFYGWLSMAGGMPLVGFLVLEGIIAAAGIVLIVAAYVRMKEIDGGEEDDLSKY